MEDKLNEDVEIVKKKVKLVAQVDYQEEEIDFHETFTQVTRLESIWMMLTFARHHEFVVIKLMLKVHSLIST